MKSKNLYTLMCAFAAMLFLFASCQKEEMLEPLEVQEIESISPEKVEKCGYNYKERILTHFLTKRTWIFDELYHEDPETNDLLNEVFAGLTMDFTKDTYHIIIPNTGRDDTGTWRFVDNFKRMLVDEGLQTEHYIGINSLKMREYIFTHNDPVFGPFTVRLVPIFKRCHKPDKNR